MSPLLIQTVLFGSEDCQKIVALRQKILRDPLGLRLDPNDLAKEGNDYHVKGEIDGVLVACLVVTPIDERRVQIRQMAVEPHLQGQALGRQMMIWGENLAREKGFKKVSLHAREIVAGFYEKMGYKKTGVHFTTLGLPHCIMEKNL